MENDVSVVSLDARLRGMERGIFDATHFFLRSISGKQFGLEVFLVGKEKMRAINLDSRGKNSATNVLSFEHPKSFPSPGGGRPEIGEIYLCPSYIKEHREDINHMLLHGILHLLGFNHKNKSDRIRMEKIERDLTAKWLNNKS